MAYKILTPAQSASVTARMVQRDADYDQDIRAARDLAFITYWKELNRRCRLRPEVNIFDVILPKENDRGI